LNNISIIDIIDSNSISKIQGNFFHQNHIRIILVQRENDMKTSNNKCKQAFIIFCIVVLLACTQEDSGNAWDFNWEPMRQNTESTKNSFQSLPENKKQPPAQKKQLHMNHAPYLIQTQWHQHYPFNKALPMHNGRRVVAGCVNIALAQIMYYYQYPLKGHGVVHHSWQGQSLTAVLDRRLYWDKMPFRMTPETPDYAIDELAAVIRDISLINQTQFGVGPHDQSGAAFDMNRFVSHFGFSSDIQQITSDQRNFFDIINQELDSKRPVLISLKGQPIDHMAIIDGKLKRGGKMRYHINMGWGGQHDSFYNLSRPIVLESLSDQQSIGQTYRFTGFLTVYYPIKPCEQHTCSLNNLEKHDQIRGHRINGRFDTTTDQDRYENILLKGHTVIQGDRGYSNQAFYIQIYDRFHQLLGSSSPRSKAIQYDFDPGIYHFIVTLCQNQQQSMHCYELDPGFEQYDVRINTSMLTTTEKQKIANNTGPPIIENELTDIILPRNFNSHIIRINAFHPMGLPVEISVKADSNNHGIQAIMDDHFLVISNRHKGHVSDSTLYVTATSNNISSRADFNIMFSGERVWFGKHIDIPGKFTGQDDQNNHRIILEKGCRLSGYNGFMNQAFYMKILDKQGKTLVNATDQEMEYFFDRGIYQIQTALKVENKTQTHKGHSISTRYYQYQQGLGDHYVIHAWCPEFSYDLNLLARDNTDSGPLFKKALSSIILSPDFEYFTIPVEVVDPDGDPIRLSAGSDHPDIETRIKNTSLEIIPHSPAIGTKAVIRVKATANNKQKETSFLIYIAKYRVDLGQEFKIKGIFSDQDDINIHPVLLSGTCHISGYNGFKNQAFFIEVLDNQKQAVKSASDYGFQNYFKGLYYLKTNLKSGARYFPYVKGNSDQYTISVSCPDSEIDERFIDFYLSPFLHQ